MTRIILFDGVCTLCNRVVAFVIRRDPHKTFRFASLQSPQGVALLRAHGVTEDAQPDSLVLIEDDSIFFLSEGALRIGRELPLPWPALSTLGFWIPRPIRDPVYRFIARNRYRWFGRCDQCSLPNAGEEDRFLNNSV